MCVNIFKYIWIQGWGWGGHGKYESIVSLIKIGSMVFKFWRFIYTNIIIVRCYFTTSASDVASVFPKLKITNYNASNCHKLCYEYLITIVIGEFNDILLSLILWFINYPIYKRNFIQELYNLYADYTEVLLLIPHIPLIVRYSC